MKLLDLVEKLVEAGLDVTLRKSDGLLCAYFPSGFYQSDGDAFVFQHNEHIILSTRIDGQRIVYGVDTVVYESHTVWRKCKNLNPKWKNAAQLWLPLYRKYSLEL